VASLALNHLCLTNVPALIQSAGAFVPGVADSAQAAAVLTKTKADPKP